MRKHVMCVAVVAVWGKIDVEQVRHTAGTYSRPPGTPGKLPEVTFGGSLGGISASDFGHSHIQTRAGVRRAVSDQ